MMTTSWGLMIALSSEWAEVCSRLRIALRPAERAGGDEDSAHREPSRPHVALLDDDDDPEKADERDDHCRDGDQEREKAEDDSPDDGVRGLDGAVANERNGAFDEVGGARGPVGHGVLGRAAYPEARRARRASARRRG